MINDTLERLLEDKYANSSVPGVPNLEDSVQMSQIDMKLLWQLNGNGIKQFKGSHIYVLLREIMIY